MKEVKLIVYEGMMFSFIDAVCMRVGEGIYKTFPVCFVIIKTWGCGDDNRISGDIHYDREMIRSGERARLNVIVELIELLVGKNKVRSSTTIICIDCGEIRSKEGKVLMLIEVKKK